MDATQVVGIFVLILNFVSAFAIFHQIRLTYRRKSGAGLSPVAWSMGMTNAFAGVLYSFLIHDLVFILANLAWFTVNSTMVVLLLRYRNGAKTLTGELQ